MTKTFNFQREKVSGDLIEESMPLLRSHQKEVMPFPETEINIDLKSYLAGEAAGILRCFVARDSSGKMIGYANFFTCSHPHYQPRKMALLDILFVKKEHRGKVGLLFLKWCDDQLFDEGIEEIHFTVQEKLDYSPVLERMGYELHSKIYTRRNS